MYCEVKDNINNFLMTIVYGRNTTLEKKSFWNRLKNYASNVNGKLWIMMGDFNVIKSGNEKFGRLEKNILLVKNFPNIATIFVLKTNMKQ